MRTLHTWMLAGLAAAAIGCSSDSTGNDTGTPSTPMTPTTPSTPGGGPVGSVVVANLSFTSSHNGTSNPAVDTVAAGEPVTWTWTGTGSVTHSVQSMGSPAFTSSQPITGDGMTYSFTFTEPGMYHYQCAFHPGVMTGTVVVQ